MYYVIYHAYDKIYVHVYKDIYTRTSVLYMYITRLDDPHNRFDPKRRGSRSIHDGMWRALLRWGRGKPKRAAFLGIVGLGEM